MWYAVLAATTLLLGLGVLLTIRHRRHGRGRKFSWVQVGGAVFAFVLAIPLIGYLVLFPPYETIPPTGDYPYLHATEQYELDRIETYAEGGRSRKLSAEVYYPSGERVENGSRPLIVFSHGGMGFAGQNISLFQEWASHGYVVISIDHTYQSLHTRIDDRDVYIDSGYLQDLSAEDADRDPRNSAARYAEWMDVRMGDIDHVIDEATRRSRSEDSFYALIDADQIAVAGHSLGGSAALGIGRTSDEISAVIALESPYMYDIVGVSGEDFLWREEPYPVPVLNVYTDSSYHRLGEWKQYGANYRLLNRNDIVSNAHLKGCGHLSITDLSLTSPVLTRALNGFGSEVSGRECLAAVNQVTLRFLESQLSD